MAGIICYNSDGTTLNCLTQWDRDVTLIVKGADTSSVPDFHFSNKHSKAALVIKATTGTGNLSVKIPDVLLQEALPLTVDLYCLLTDGSTRTKHTVTIPVTPKARPSDYEYIDVSDHIGIDGRVVISNRDPGGSSLLWVDTN